MKRQEMKDYTVYIYIINRELKYRNDSKFTFIDIFLFFNLTKNYEPLFFFSLLFRYLNEKNTNKTGCKLDGKGSNGRNIEAIMLAHVVN